MWCVRKLSLDRFSFNEGVTHKLFYYHPKYTRREDREMRPSQRSFIVSVLLFVLYGMAMLFENADAIPFARCTPKKGTPKVPCLALAKTWLVNM